MSEQGCTRPHLGDLLAAYEMGLLEADDRIRFESHLAECPACVEELYAGAPAGQALRCDPARFAAVLENAAGSVPSCLPARLGGFLRRLLMPRVLVPVGAVVAGALALLTLMPGSGPSIADLAVVQPLPYQGLQLRGGPQQVELLAEGMAHYTTEDYQAAADVLGQAWESGRGDRDWPDRHRTALFLGLCLLLDDRSQEAVAPLTAAAEAPLLPIAERGKWYLAQTHLLLEDPQAGLPLLESLLNSPVYGDSAHDQLLSVRQICDNSHGR